jgi:hypothetical protein
VMSDDMRFLRNVIRTIPQVQALEGMLVASLDRG